MHKARLFMPLAAAFALAAPAGAEVTADQLWSALRAAVNEGGARLTATESRRGDRLLLTRAQIAFDDGATLFLPDLTLRETSDRAVTLDLPPRFPLVLDLPPNPTDPDKLTMSVAAPDLAITVTGLGEEAGLKVTAGSVSASLDPFLPPPGGGGPADFFMALALADLSLDWTHDLNGPDLSASGALKLGTAHAEVRLDLPAEDVKGSAALDLSAIEASLSALAPADTDPAMDRLDRGEAGLAEFLALLDQGLHVRSSAASGPVALIFDAPRTAEGPASLDLSLASWRSALTFDRAGLSSDSALGALRLAFSGKAPDAPFAKGDLALTEYRAAYSVGLPGTTAGADSAPWSVLLRLTGLTVSPSLWALMDPGALLPRDPLSLAIGLDGSYSLDPQALRPGFRMAPGAPPPITALTLNLTELMLSGLGVTFTGSGGMGLDFTDMTTFDGAPLPSGKLSFVTTGANGLIDRLGRLGALTKDEITSLRFGLMFLGRVEGDDRLVSAIEVRDKTVYLNGQKIR